MKRGAEGSVVVRRNPGYNPNLDKEWLVLHAGVCVGEFDKRSEADALCAKVIEGLPTSQESGLSRRQELKNEYRATPKREIRKRRELRAELDLIKAQEAQAKEKGKTKRVKKVVEYLCDEHAKAKTFHYHKGRRGRCSCERGADNE